MTTVTNHCDTTTEHSARRTPNRGPVGRASSAAADRDDADRHRCHNRPVCGPNSAAAPQSSQAWQAERARRLAAGIDVPTLLWIAIVHLGAFAAPWTFTWQGLVALVLLHWLTGGVGICLGYHRLLTHRSFTTFRPGAG